MLTDTHAHLCDPIFDEDREEVLARAKAGGIDAIIAVGENLADARRNLELAQNHSLLRPAAGLYPDVPDVLEAERMLVLIRTQRRHLAAIGEVGLDHWVVKDDAAREIQRDIFRRFIELSKELDLPLNVHSRSAGRHAVKLLLECGAVRVQLHAFDGKASAALPAVEAGYFFSIPPSIVRSRQKQKLVKNLPLSCLLIESDSPVLGPDPQQRNEPANSILAIDAIADLKNVPREAVVEAVMDNTRRLYGPLGP
jgi:TatD DNase family protein